MGEPMAGYLPRSKKFDAVWVFDINKAATKGIARQGAIKGYHADDVAKPLCEKEAPYLGKIYPGKPISAKD